jgi:hypothetical protein
VEIEFWLDRDPVSVVSHVSRSHRAPNPLAWRAEPSGSATLKARRTTSACTSSPLLS